MEDSNRLLKRCNNKIFAWVSGSENGQLSISSFPRSPRFFSLSESVVFRLSSSLWHSRIESEDGPGAGKPKDKSWAPARSHACWSFRRTEVRVESSWIYELHALEEPLMLETYLKLSCESWMARLTSPAMEPTVLKGSAMPKLQYRSNIAVVRGSWRPAKVKSTLVRTDSRWHG